MNDKHYCACGTAIPGADEIQPKFMNLKQKAAALRFGLGKLESMNPELAKECFKVFYKKHGNQNIIDELSPENMTAFELLTYVIKQMGFDAMINHECGGCCVMDGLGCERFDMTCRAAYLHRDGIIREEIEK